MITSTFEILYFIAYPPPYPQPTRNFFDPKTGAFFQWAWPDHKVGVNIRSGSSNPLYPETVKGVPVILPEIRDESQMIAFAPAWRSLTYTWERFFSDPDRVLKEIHTNIIKTPKPAPPVSLTRREKRILRDIALGIPYRAIADSMQYSTKTISTIVSTLKDKLFADSAPAMIARACSLGIIDPNEILLSFHIERNRRTPSEPSEGRQNLKR